MTKSDELLADLVHAIAAKWDGESERRRANALSPKIEKALREAKRHLRETGVPIKKTRLELMDELRGQSNG